MKGNRIKRFNENPELNISDVMKRISELEREYYNLEDDWLKDKSFKKLDRKYEIQKVFSELGISLKDWGKKYVS